MTEPAEPPTAPARRPSGRPGQPKTPGTRTRWVLADHLRALIRHRGYPSLSEAAEAIGMAQSQLSNYLHGKTPRPATLARVLAGLEATEADLLAVEVRPCDRNERYEAR